MMKDTVLIKKTVEDAETFVRHMSIQGYEPAREEGDGVCDIHFLFEGKVSIKYSATLFEDHAFVGVRPD